MKRLYCAENLNYLYCHDYGTERYYAGYTKRDLINWVNKGFNILYAYELSHKNKLL